MPLGGHSLVDARPACTVTPWLAPAATLVLWESTLQTGHQSGLYLCLSVSIY